MGNIIKSKGLACFGGPGRKLSCSYETNSQLQLREHVSVGHKRAWAQPDVAFVFLDAAACQACSLRM